MTRPTTMKREIGLNDGIRPTSANLPVSQKYYSNFFQWAENRHQGRQSSHQEYLAKFERKRDNCQPRVDESRVGYGMDYQLYEGEILTRTTPRERLEAYFEMVSRYPEWPAGSINAVRVQAAIIKDLVALVLPIARAEELDDV